MSTEDDQASPLTGFQKTVAAAGAGLILAAALILWASSPAVFGEAELNGWIQRAPGALGAALIVGLIAISVVASPIPGGPVAMSAGALYGAVVGGFLTLAGAFLGALLAFTLARIFGRGPVTRSSLQGVAWIARPRSQSSLMLLVFGSRLIPFISFDAVSYAAGLTSLSAGRFALATFLGIAPSSFAFAALGKGVSELHDGIVVALAATATILFPALLFGRRALTRIFYRSTFTRKSDELVQKKMCGMIRAGERAFARDLEETK